MLALTLWPEWAWAIAHLDKRVENRDWPADRALWGQRIAIHAGKHIGGRAAESAYWQGLGALCSTGSHSGWDIDPTATGKNIDGDGRFAVLRAKRLSHVRVKDPEPPWGKHIPIATSAIVATARLVGCYRGLRDRWADPEAWGWKLDEVLALPKPVEGVRGFQKLWTLSTADEARVLEQVAR